MEPEPSVLATSFCPDALEYDSASGTLLCCTYLLDAASGTKSGSLDVLRVEGAAPRPRSLVRLSSSPQRAVFDARWQRGGAGVGTGGALCAVALEGGGVSLSRLVSEPGTASASAPASPPSALECVASLVLQRLGNSGGDSSGSDSALPTAAPLSALYVDWLASPPLSHSTGIIVARSDGCVSALELGEAAALRPVSAWRAHSLGGAPIEVWVASASPHSRDVAWTGGDDGLLKGWDLRAPLSAAHAAPAFVSRAHGAGVTAIAFHPTNPHIVATGSYDERLRLWDCRRVSAAPLATLASPLGGGVWRLRWRPAPEGSGALLLAACMLGGVHVVRVREGVSGEGGGSEEALCSEFHYARHKSLVYAAEWLCGEVGEPSLVASCGFYDSEVHLWQLPELMH